jgi:hypothetical protein
MSDDLDTKTEAEISEIFAVEVAGFNTCTGCNQIRDILPNFVYDANVVLPWLNNHDARIYHSTDWLVQIGTQPNSCAWVVNIEARAKTFARAACLALIRARRAEKGAGK